MSVPFSERPTCTIAEACEASGLGRTLLYEAMHDGRLASIKIGGRRLVVIASLLKMLEPERLSDAA
jgi:excisionase family DNA binding protein